MPFSCTMTGCWSRSTTRMAPKPSDLRTLWPLIRRRKKVRICPALLDQKVQRFRNRSRWTFSFFVPAADGFFACDRRNDGRNKTQKICRICRISRLKLCISPNKNLENVSILRKNNRLCLQNGYRLVYFMAVKREKWCQKREERPDREYRSANDRT